MRMFHGTTHRDKDLEPIFDREPFRITVLRNCGPLDPFHCEVFLTLFRAILSEYLCNVRVRQLGKDLSLRLEGRQGLIVRRFLLEDLDRDRAFQSLLPSFEDHLHLAF